MKSKSLFYKATLSASCGLPLAYVINLSVLPHITAVIESNPYLASALIAIPFFVASQMRIFSIDYIYEKYHINIDPIHLIKRIMS